MSMGKDKIINFINLFKIYNISKIQKYDAEYEKITFLRNAL